MKQPSYPIHPLKPVGEIPAAPQQDTFVESGHKIYPRAITGWFATWRWVLVWFTQIIFYGLPWLQWNNRQAVLFDLTDRKFFIFGQVFWPQDFIYLAVLLVIAALSLFLFTAVAGRLWCGYACPQTVYTEIFLWVEQKIEGDHLKRKKLDAQPMSARKLAIKSSKQLVWIAIALWTGFTFVGYFTPIHTLAAEVGSLTLGPWEIFWILFYGLATYGNAGYMRELVCTHMCPYARFQGVMFDPDSLIITYDPERGEPRGSRGKKVDYKAAGLGDCIDCHICVQVCPTGIDIRKGLQYECIGCAACIDGCNQVMDKMGYARGLIRYSTENAMDQHLTWQQMVRRVLRPRTLVYTAVLWTIIIAAGVALYSQKPLKVNIIRDRVNLVREAEDGKIENVYQLQIMNTTEASHRYVISATGLPNIEVVSEQQPVEVPGNSTRSVSLRLKLIPGGLKPGAHPIQFHIQSQQEERAAVDEKSSFITR